MLETSLNSPLRLPIPDLNHPLLYLRPDFIPFVSSPNKIPNKGLRRPEDPRSSAWRYEICVVVIITLKTVFLTLIGRCDKTKRRLRPKIHIKP